MTSVRTKRLFDEDDEEERVDNLKINRKFAKQFNSDRERQQLAHLSEKYGEESESSGSSEDETGEKKLPITFDESFMNVLASIKKKDPKIYDSSHTFFNAETSDFQSKPATTKKESEKKGVFIPDIEMNLLMKYEGRGFPEDEEKKQLKKKFFGKESDLTYIQEQEQLKLSLKSAALDNSESDEEGLLTKRKPSKKELAKQDKEYTRWKKRELDKKAQKNLDELLEASRKSKKDELLFDYVLNKKYVDPNIEEKVDDESDNGEHFPTYDEIISAGDVELVEQSSTDGSDDETGDNDFARKISDIHLPDTTHHLKAHPRVLNISYRKKDPARREKRLLRRTKKEQEKLQRTEELKQLKILKRKEIMQKLERIKNITGNEKMGFDSLDIDGDFDPNKHDQQMQDLFNQDYYGDDNVDEEKPQFSEDEDEAENWDEWQGNKNEVEPNEVDPENYNEPHCEDPDFNMDCEYDPNAKVKDDRKRPGRKRKIKKSSFAKAIEKKKPEFDPSNKAFEEYFDEYYKLDYEDVIGGIPCRFKYRKVVPNDFGLSVEEILAADVKELNQWCPVSKMSQYRVNSEENTDVIRYRQKGGKLERKKKKIFASLFPSEEDSTKQSTKKSRKAKKSETAACKPDDSTNVSVELCEPLEESTNDQVDQVSHKKSKKRLTKCPDKEVDAKPVSPKSSKKRKLSVSQDVKGRKDEPVAHKKSKKRKQTDYRNDGGLTDARLQAYEIKPKKFWNKMIYGNMQ